MRTLGEVALHKFVVNDLQSQSIRNAESHVSAARPHLSCHCDDGHNCPQTSIATPVGAVDSRAGAGGTRERTISIFKVFCLPTVSKLRQIKKTETSASRVFGSFQISHYLPVFN